MILKPMCRPLGSVYFFVLMGGLSTAWATSIENDLKFNESYISPIISNTNQVANKSNSQVKEVVQGKGVSIPSGWRLVNVVSKGADFVLFFQAQDGAVHSFGISSNGSLTGHDTLHIPSHR